MIKVFLKTGEQKRIVNGHRWVYDNEVERIEGSYKPGDIVDVYDFKGRFVGRGFINPNSKIIVRLLSNSQEDIDREFFRKRIQWAWDYRKLTADVNCCRVIFAEADFMPGLVVDKYGDYLVIQSHALGIDIHMDTIVELLDEIVKPKGIFERNESTVRKLEGLEQRKGFLKGKFDTTFVIEENGIKLWVDIENGQKTGYFLDQKENRASIAPFVKDARVLDCFSHTGSFAIHACNYGAKEAISVDISDYAVDTIRKNVALNGFDDKITALQGDAFEVLKELQGKGEKFDVVILDPPAFTKTQKAVKGAMRGYKDINLRGMKITKDGGFLVTCSCSHYMTSDLFMEVIKDAAKDAKRTLRQVEFRTQSKDHPILVNAEESLYLKFAIFQVFNI
jgi:23S rRNA (cytosine1962-C5)-methyltransferase